MQRIVVINYRRFGIIYRSHQEIQEILGLLTLEYRTDGLSRKVFKELLLYTAEYLRRAQVSSTSRQKHEITISLLQSAHPDSGARPASYSMGRGALSPGIKQLDLESGQSESLSAEVKKEWILLHRVQRNRHSVLRFVSGSLHVSVTKSASLNVLISSKASPSLYSQKIEHFFL